MKHRALTEQIIGAFYDVYNELGHGFLESVYGNAMAIALRAREASHSSARHIFRSHSGEASL